MTMVKEWIHTGSSWVPLLGDSDGHVQVDALSCANPPNLDAKISDVLADLNLYVARNKSLLVYSNAVDNGIAIVHTVTAGKKYYLFAVHLYVYHFAAGAHGGFAAVRDGADTFLYTLIQRGCADADDGSGGEIPFPIPNPIPAGYDIYIYANAESSARATIYGWEE